MTARDLAAAGGLDGGKIVPLRSATSAHAPIFRALAELGPDPLANPPRARQYLLSVPQSGSFAGMLPLGKTAMLAAAGSAGKTMAMLQLAVSVATGRPWLGTFHVDHPGRVFALLAEESTEEVHRRLCLVSDAMRLDEGARALVTDRLRFAAMEGRPVAAVSQDAGGNVDETPWLGQLRDELRAQGPARLVVLDPLSRLGSADTELSNAAATRFVQAIETLIEASGGGTILVCHHTSKDARKGGKAHQTNARGASALTDAFRWQGEFEPAGADEPDALTFKVTKSNYARVPKPVALRRGFGGVLQIAPSSAAGEHATVERGE
jgi:RecA-family ATPase